MKNRLFRYGLLLFAVAACGKVQMGTSPVSSNSSGSTNNGRVKTLSSAESTAVTGSSSSSQNSDAIRFNLAEATLNQGESLEVNATLEGGAPSSTVMLSVPQAVQQVKVEFLDLNSGSPLNSGLALDTAGNGKFKVRVTSEFLRTTSTVTAPGIFNGKLTVQAQGGSSALTGSLPLKVSNVALFVMSGVTAVEQLPATFEFPAGTIPVFANPPAPATPVVSVFHFQTGQFKHQNTGSNMGANMGYCPLNSNSSAVVTVGSAVPSACQPCPPDAMQDMTGSFYKHGGSATNPRTIICK
ncbi:MAG: hypothetical protein RIR26_1916, partial [Pseudomonadota bacterium]